MLKTDPISLFDQIAPSETLRDAVVDSSYEMIREYHGPHYLKGQQSENPAPENHWWEWLNTVTPQVVYDNPTVHVTSRRSGPFRDAADALAAGLNAWCPRVNLWRTLMEVFHDAAFSFGVVRVAYEPQPGTSGELRPFAPRAYRVAPHRWFCDASADRYDPLTGRGRFAGHMWRRDKDDLLADPRYDHEAVAELAADAELGKWDGKAVKKKGQKPRNEIMGYEIWVPEVQLTDDPLANGALYTLATAQNQRGDSSEPRWIRDPRPYYGPPSGPYTLFGFHLVPDCPYPLSPFAATYEQVKALNAHVTAAARSASRQKRLVAVDATHASDADTIQDAKDGSVVLIDGLKDGAAQQIDLGGAADSVHDYIDRLRERRDRVTGLSDLDRGNVAEDATATAVAEAANQRNARLSLLQRGFQDATNQVLQTAGWYLYQMEDAVMPLPQEVADETISRFIGRDTGIPSQEVHRQMRELDYQPTVTFTGGPADETITELLTDDVNPEYALSPNVPGMAFDDLELSIEAYSMGRTNEAVLQRNTLQLAEIVPGLLEAHQKFPHLNLEELLDMIGQPMNLRGLSERLLDRALMGQMTQMMSGGAVPPPGAPEGPANPAPAPMQAAQQAGNLAGQASRT